MLAERNLSPDRHLWARALVGALDNGEGRDLQRHAELDALRQTEIESRRRLEDVIDWTGLSIRHRVSNISTIGMLVCGEDCL